MAAKKKAKKVKKVKQAKKPKKPVVDPFYPLHPVYSGEYQKPKGPPKRGRWIDTGSMSQSRYFQKSVLLKDGRILVAGGKVPNICWRPSRSGIRLPGNGARPEA